MSSKRLIYFLMVLLVCGLIASGTAHAQIEIDVLRGKVTNPDGDTRCWCQSESLWLWYYRH